MQILPVLDLMHGVVVHGVAGEREKYRPIDSQLTRETDPLSVARAFRDHFGLTMLYLADLDAIAGRPPSFAIYDSLLKEGFQLWLDPGIRSLAQATHMTQGKIASLVIGLETLPDAEILQKLRGRIDPLGMIISLDMKHKQPLTANGRWRGLSILEIADEIVTLGFTRLLLLDLAQVGTGAGPCTHELGGCLRTRYGDVLYLATGGGVRDSADLSRLSQAGYDAVLIASALHNGKLRRVNMACNSHLDT